jgi:hypothetical protein
MPEPSRLITFHSHQFGFIHQLFYCTLQSQKRLPDNIASSDDDNIKPSQKLWMKMADRFTQQASRSIPCDRVTCMFTDDKSIPIIIQSIWQEAQNHQPMMIAAPRLTQPSEIFSPAKPETPLHPSA